MVPILSVTGGDERPMRKPGTNNDRPEWTQKTLQMIRSGGVKRVKLDLMYEVPGQEQ